MDRSERERPTPTDEPRQFSAVDHSARAPMKNAASCENQCELQNAVIIGISNAHGGPGPPRPGPRPPEGRRQTRNRRGPARPGRPRRESAGRQPRGPAPREDTGCRRLEGTAKSQVAAPPPPLSGEDEPHGYPERERENGHRPGAGSAPRAGRRTPRGSPPRRGRSALSIRPTREPVVPQQVERFERWALDPAAGEHPPAGARCPGQIRLYICTYTEPGGRRETGAGERRGVAGRAAGGGGGAATRVPPARERDGETNRQRTRSAVTSRRGRRGGRPESPARRSPSARPRRPQRRARPTTSGRARGPAGFKHITKRRKRN